MATAEPRAVPLPLASCCPQTTAAGPRGWTGDALPWAYSSTREQGQLEALNISQEARRTSINSN